MTLISILLAEVRSVAPDRRLGGIQCSRDRDVAGSPAAAGILHVDRVADLAIAQGHITTARRPIGRHSQVNGRIGRADIDRTIVGRDDGIVAGCDRDRAGRGGQRLRCDIRFSRHIDIALGLADRGWRGTDLHGARVRNDMKLAVFGVG